METKKRRGDSASTITRFKSYYVVWKPVFRAAAFRAAAMFKSYYVVWKQNKRRGNSASAIGLNRTM